MYDRDILKELMNKPMSRKEFLHNLGLLFLSLFGASALLGLMLKESPKSLDQSVTKKASRGYGGSGYGL